MNIAVSACISAEAAHGGAGGKFVGTTSEGTALTLIIDAGHGGADGGAVSLSGVKESEINLEIALKLDQIMAFFGVSAVMTRSTEELDYSEKANTIREKKAEDQNKRIHLINSTKNAILISIHQNKFPDGRPFGAQVLYAPTSGSKEFAEYMQNSLITALNEQNRRSAAKVPGSILLLNHIKCPAIIIECGFLSNADEEELLRTDAYQLKVAAVIAAGFLANQNSLKTLYSGGMNES
jgi:N-acetylmuramoyl-L-alanine amidase